MLHKLVREIKGWRKSALCPYLHWQITLNIFVFFCHLREFWVSFNWFIFLNFIFLHFMPHGFLLDARHARFTVLAITVNSYTCSRALCWGGVWSFRVWTWGFGRGTGAVPVWGELASASCPGPHESVWLVETGSVLDPLWAPGTDPLLLWMLLSLAWGGFWHVLCWWVEGTRVGLLSPLYSSLRSGTPTSKLWPPQAPWTRSTIFVTQGVWQAPADFLSCTTAWKLSRHEAGQSQGSPR